MRKFVPLALALGLLCFVAPRAVRADDEADLRAVVTKAVKAHGGEEALTKNKASTIKAKGTVKAAGLDIEYTGTIQIQAPGQMRVEMDLDVMGKNFNVLQVLNKDKAWIKLMDNVMELDKDAVAEMHASLYASHIATELVPLLKDKEYKLSPLGEVKVGDVDTIGVQVKRKDRRDVSLYFDKKSGLLLKTEFRAKDPQGGQEFNQETVYSSYKEFGGVKVATKSKIKRDGKDFADNEITEFTGHEKLGDETFAKP